MTYNHNRPVEDFEEQLNIIRSAGFNPIAVSQMYFEDTFVFETDEEAHKAYETLERDANKKLIGRVVGWWYSRDRFAETILEYEEKMKNKVLTHWLK